MKVDFDKSEISVVALLECFSIPSNVEYLLTEIGIAINFYQNLAVDKNLLNPYQLQVKDSEKTNTLFSIFSNENQKQFTKTYIANAKLVVKDTKEIKKEWGFICDFVSSQFQNTSITITIKFSPIKNALDIISVSAESDALTENELRSLPLILMLIQA